MKHHSKQKVAYVHLGQTHLEYGAVARALEERGIVAELVHLRDVERVDWADYALVNIRMCRGFHLEPSFLPMIEGLHARLRAVAGRTVPLVNSLDLIYGALDKKVYLKRLEADGVRIVPTRWVERSERVTLGAIMAEEGWDDVVVKPTVSSRSWSTFRVAGEGHPRTSQATYYLTDGADVVESMFAEVVERNHVCVQPFFPAILTRGESSFVFLGGSFSHAVRKTVGGGGWWAHELLGGTNQAMQATAAEIAWAEGIYARLERWYGELAFGRIDGITTDAGEVMLLECELVIPRLLLPEGAAFDRYADAIARRVDAR